MFEELLRELKKLESGTTLSVPIEPDDKGYIDKECPSEECLFQFKILVQDWTNLFNDDSVFCPMCRNEAAADQWFTTAQVEHSHNEGLEHISGRIQNAMTNDAKQFNRKSPKGGFLSISMDVRGPKHRSFILPAPAAEEMQLEIQCENCTARFSVIGSAYFCPCCGCSSVSRVFNDSLNKVKAKISNLSAIKSALTSIEKADEAELTCRSLIESSIQDCVTAFQRFCEEMYNSIPNQKSAPFNAFQRLKHGSELWEKAIGEGYGNWLPSENLNELNISYQRRHLLAHRDGIVDQEYINKTNDITYKVGQRIVVSKNDVTEMVNVISVLAEKIVEKLNA